MVWRRPGGKPLSEPMMARLLIDICVSRPQWAICQQRNTTKRGLWTQLRCKPHTLIDDFNLNSGLTWTGVYIQGAKYCMPVSTWCMTEMADIRGNSDDQKQPTASTVKIEQYLKMYPLRDSTKCGVNCVTSLLDTCRKPPISATSGPQFGQQHK